MTNEKAPDPPRPRAAHQRTPPQLQVLGELARGMGSATRSVIEGVNKLVGGLSSTGKPARPKSPRSTSATINLELERLTAELIALAAKMDPKAPRALLDDKEFWVLITKLKTLRARLPLDQRPGVPQTARSSKHSKGGESIRVSPKQQGTESTKAPSARPAAAPGEEGRAVASAPSSAPQSEGVPVDPLAAALSGGEDSDAAGLDASPEVEGAVVPTDDAAGALTSVSEQPEAAASDTAAPEAEASGGEPTKESQSEETPVSEQGQPAGPAAQEPSSDAEPGGDEGSTTSSGGKGKKKS